MIFLYTLLHLCIIQLELLPYYNTFERFFLNDVCPVFSTHRFVCKSDFSNLSKYGLFSMIFKIFEFGEMRNKISLSLFYDKFRTRESTLFTLSLRCPFRGYYLFISIENILKWSLTFSQIEMNVNLQKIHICTWIFGIHDLICTRLLNSC